MHRRAGGQWECRPADTRQDADGWVPPLSYSLLQTLGSGSCNEVTDMNLGQQGC